MENGVENEPYEEKSEPHKLTTSKDKCLIRSFELVTFVC